MAGRFGCDVLMIDALPRRCLLDTLNWLFYGEGLEKESEFRRRWGL